MTEVNTNLGTILETLNNKLDRDLLNIQYEGFDFVIKWKAPTTDDPTWYRLYKSGWCEQGGIVTTVSKKATITFQKEFTNINYYLLASQIEKGSNTGDYFNGFYFYNKTTATVDFWNAQEENPPYIWEAKGLIDINNI